MGKMEMPGGFWERWDRDKEETKMGTEWERRVGRCIRHGVGNFFLGVFVDVFLLLCLLAEPAIISWGMGY